MISLSPNPPFSLKQELLNLCLPLLFCLLVFLELVGWISAQHSWLVMISLYAALHHLLSISLIAESPALREWIQVVSGGRPVLFWLKVVVSALLFFLGIYFALTRLRDYGPAIELVLLAILIFDHFVVATFHMISQSKGLSLLYSHFGTKPAKNLLLARKFEKIERRAAGGLIASVAVAAFFFGAHRIQSGFLPNLAEFGWIGFCFLFAAFACAAVNVWACFRMAKLQNSGKGLFSLRMLLWPFYPVSVVAQSSLRIVHALEYFLTTSKITLNRRSTGILWLSVALPFLFLVYGGVLSLRGGNIVDYYYGGASLWGGVPARELRILSYCVYATANVVHIVADSLIFRMSRPVSHAATMQYLVQSSSFAELNSIHSFQGVPHAATLIE